MLTGREGGGVGHIKLGPRRAAFLELFRLGGRRGCSECRIERAAFCARAAVGLYEEVAAVVAATAATAAAEGTGEDEG